MSSCEAWDEDIIRTTGSGEGPAGNGGDRWPRGVGWPIGGKLSSGIAGVTMKSLVASLWLVLASLANSAWAQGGGLIRAAEMRATIRAQESANQHGTQSDADNDPEGSDKAAARVIAIGGRVERSILEGAAGESGPIGGLEEGSRPTSWRPIVEGESLPTGTWLRTGFSSFVTLRFGENEYVSIRHLTLASVDDFRPMPGGDRIRIGLGYGTVRGGSADHAIRSDLAVEAPTATLAKRGTEGWEIRVEPGTGRYRISLARSGLVEALEQARRGIGRLVRPGEYVTQDTLAGLWIQQAQFDRMAGVYKLEGMTGADERFALKNTSGLGFINPGGGEELYALNNRGEPSTLRNPVSAALAAGTRPNLRFGVIDSPVGNFGSPGVLNPSPNP